MNKHAQRTVYHWLLPWLQRMKHSREGKQKCCDFKIQHLPQRFDFLTIEFMQRKCLTAHFIIPLELSGVIDNSEK